MSELSGGAVKVFLELAWRDYTPEHAYPSIEALISATGMARSSVVRALREIADKGIVEITQGGGRGHANVYRVLLPLSAGKGIETDSANSIETKPFSDETVSKPAEKGFVSITETVSNRNPKIIDEGELEDDRSARARACEDSPETGNHHHRVNPESVAPWGAVAPDGADHPGTADMAGSGSILERRVLAWTVAGLMHSTGTLTPDRVDRIEALSDTEWAQLLAYVQANDFLRKRPLAYIACKADQWKTTLSKARAAVPRPRTPAPPGASEAVQWWLTADRDTRKFAVIKLGIAYPESADLQDESPHIGAAWELLSELEAAPDDDERQRIMCAARRRAREEGRGPKRCSGA